MSSWTLQSSKMVNWPILLPGGIQYAMIVLPYLVVAPMYFSGEVEYGVVSQSSMAFYRVKMAMNVIINQFNAFTCSNYGA